MNKFARFGFLIQEETIFYAFLFLFTFFYLLFLDKEKIHCIKDSRLTVMVCRLNMQHRKTIRKENKIK